MSLATVACVPVPGRVDCELCPLPAAVVVTLLDHRGWGTTFKKHWVCVKHAFADLSEVVHAGRPALFEPVVDEDDA